nr:carbohydrate kinase [Oculatella sp. LEGE 06141]
MGEILWDCLADQPGVPLEQVTSWTSYPGGAPANVACALTKLGTPTGFIGCVGEDEQGRSLVDLLQTIGVDCTGIQWHPTAPTREIFVLRSESGDRQFIGFGDRDTADFADTHLQAKQLPVSLFDAADFLVVGTLEMPYPETQRAIAHSLELAEQHFVKVLLDVNWRPMFWPDVDAAKPVIQHLMKQSDFIKLSEEEAEWLFDTTDPGVITHRLGSVEGVIVTFGAQGCAYCLGGNESKLPAFEMEVEDTTGAGDAFVAGFLHQLCLGGIQALRAPEVSRKVMVYATACGALTTTRPGAIAAQPTAAEVEAFLYLQQPFAMK